MLHRHDFTVLCPGCCFQLRRQRIGSHRQRVVPRHQPLLRQTAEQRAGSVKCNAGLLAVHKLPGVGDCTAERGADGLMPEADAQQRHLLPQLHGGHRDACVLRSAGPGRQNDPIRVQGAYLLQRHFIVAYDTDRRAERPDKLVQVVGKAVVIVDKQCHSPSSSAALSALTTACALLMHS